MNKTYNITIEGNIAAGKSTLLKYLDNVKDCQIVWEPIDSWKNIGNQNLLNLMYTDPKQFWSFSTEELFILNRLFGMHDIIYRQQIINTYEEIDRLIKS